MRGFVASVILLLIFPLGITLEIKACKVEVKLADELHAQPLRQLARLLREAGFWKNERRKLITRGPGMLGTRADVKLYLDSQIEGLPPAVSTLIAHADQFSHGLNPALAITGSRVRRALSGGVGPGPRIDSDLDVFAWLPGGGSNLLMDAALAQPRNIKNAINRRNFPTNRSKFDQLMYYGHREFKPRINRAAGFDVIKGGDGIDMPLLRRGSSTNVDSTGRFGYRVPEPSDLYSSSQVVGGGRRVTGETVHPSGIIVVIPSHRTVFEIPPVF